jgi:hypothetical protein
MHKFFNTAGACQPDIHYVVDSLPRLSTLIRESGIAYLVKRVRICGKVEASSAIHSSQQE